MDTAFKDQLKTQYRVSKENNLTSLSLKYHMLLCNAAEKAATSMQSSASVQSSYLEHSDDLVQSLTNMFDEMGLKFTYTEDPLGECPSYYRITGWCEKQVDAENLIGYLVTEAGSQL